MKIIKLKVSATSAPCLSTTVAVRLVCPPLWLCAQFVHHCGCAPSLSTTAAVHLVCPPLWLCTQFVHRCGCAPSLSTTVALRLVCPPLWLCAQFIHHCGFAPSLSTTVAVRLVRNSLGGGKIGHLLKIFQRWLFLQIVLITNYWWLNLPPSPQYYKGVFYNSPKKLAFLKTC